MQRALIKLINSTEEMKYFNTRQDERLIKIRDLSRQLNEVARRYLFDEYYSLEKDGD